MQVLERMQKRQRGRPPKTGSPTELERERGRRVATWIRLGISPPKTPIDLNNADVARLTGLSQSAVGYYLNDCYDNSEDRIRLPTDETLRKLADGLHLNYDEGIAARYWLPETKPKEESTLLSPGLLVRLSPNGKNIRLTDNLLRRIEFEAELEASKQAKN